MTIHSSEAPAYWVVVPAGGIGSRMEADRPKQYLSLLGKTVLEHTLDRLLTIPLWKHIHVAVADTDAYWQELACAYHARVRRVSGGRERADSVLNSLMVICETAPDHDWVLVHDAARPCIRVEEILTLIDEVSNHPVGGILGVPVSDTLKEVSGITIQKTLDRSVLWQAQTPQMFRVGLLRDCLQRALAESKPVTDEASAMESCGYKPIIVQGRGDNIKITRPEDLTIAAALMQLQGQVK